MMSELGCSVEISYTYMLGPRLILMIQTCVYIHLLGAGDSLHCLFLLILILGSNDLYEMLILLYTVIFHISWCRFMIVVCFSLSLASLFTLYIYSLTEYYIILTPLCLCGLQVEVAGKRRD